MWNPFARSADSRARSAPEVARPEPRGAGESVSAGDGIAEVELIGSTAVATLTATELSQQDGADRLSALLDEVAQTGALHIVLDVQNVHYMDTACLGCLVQALNNLAERGGRIALANPNHSVHYVFRLTRLDRVFRICSNVMAAIEAVEQIDEA
jgi:anti-anti-sigma factor